MNYLSVDLGATSGRIILGTLRDGRVSQEELTRFDHPLVQTPFHVHWDLLHLWNEILRGLRIVARRGVELTSIGIDTWGVDVVMIGKDGEPLRSPVAYRQFSDPKLMEDFFREVMPRDEVYRRTGIQFMPFNTLFQLYAMRRWNDSALEAADKILFMPDALSYLLTGKAVTERTIASTGQLLNPVTRQWDEDILGALGLSSDSFAPLVEPGTVIGTLSRRVQELTGLGAVPVVAVAGHDTASAVAAVPAADKGFAYLSSGTWSLMGIESPQPIVSSDSQAKNFTNEGGIEGTTRFLKNICGMWLYEQCRLQWKGQPGIGHQELQDAADQEPAFRSLILPDAPEFAAPKNMVEAILDFCHRTGQPVPESKAQIVRCIFDSLALRYRQVMQWLGEFAAFDIKVLHVIGGGSVNRYMNQYTANATGLPVLAGPQEGTALGNIMLQAKASGEVTDIWHMRHIIAQSIELQRYEPRPNREQEEAYERFMHLTSANNE